MLCVHGSVCKGKEEMLQKKEEEEGLPRIRMWGGEEKTVDGWCVKLDPMPRWRLLSLLLFSIFASLHRVGLWGYSEFKQFDDFFLHSGMAISRRNLSVAALPPPLVQ